MRRLQQGHLERNGASWNCRYRDVERQPDGTIKSVNRSHRLCSSKIKRADALELMRAYVRGRVNVGQGQVEASSTVAHFIESEYLPDKKNNTAPSTYKSAFDIWKCHGAALDPTIRLRDFNTFDGELLMRAIAKRAYLSRTTLKHIKSFFSGVFTHALRLGFIESGNPMHFVSLPKDSAPTVDTYAYSPEEIEAMLRVLPEPANTIVMLAAHTGLRRSEIRGLVWGDWNGDTLQVSRSMWRTETRETKSKSSHAPIPVSRELQARLMQFKPADAMPHDPIFIGPKCKRPLQLVNIVERIIIPTLQLCATCSLSKEKHATLTHPFAAMPQWRGFHAYRRGLATFLHSKGVQDLIIQRILRHSNVSITQACYIKVVSSDVREAINQMDGAFGRAQLPPSKGVA